MPVSTEQTAVDAAGFAGRDVTVRSSAVLDLNVVKVRLMSNQEDFAGFSYFSAFADPATEADFEIVCVDLDRDPYDTEPLAAASDRTFRAKRFRTGFYLVHFFGAPAYLITRGRRFHVFGHRLEKTVWPYFVKYILTMHAVDHGMLHLKSAGFAHDDGSATLLVGRQGGGKTVFLAQACLAGADFLANTHVLVDDGVAHGVHTAMRIRADACFGDLIKAHDLTPHIESGDHVVSPHDLFEGRTTPRAPVRNIVLADFDPSRPRGLEETTPQAMTAFLTQFSSALTMYGLKDDLYDHCGKDLETYTRAHEAMARRLSRLVHGARLFRANVDMLDARTRDDTLARLAGR
ncbi:FomB family phosphonate monophosphate kinase [Streptomyces tagetis]|uniref:FomB family phosphonate monophosphate kinase n=1 Tax=Streptomyces tagetis TaxID=2820809 RepID=A0A941AYK7_9ACTN|nr:FomB family phosphonate monophosphate kinase [Streptomyces sp. RG38]MBQ0825160.1 FomB family phosphonate monophosphate kinase [Streptomyces sp. RG38]